MGPDEFRLRYIAENVPLVLDGLAASWPALQRWITRDGMPDYEYLKARYGGEQVPVTLQNYENETTADFGCSRMVFEDYLTYLQVTYIVMAYIVMAYIVMAYIVMTRGWCLRIISHIYSALSHTSRTTAA